MEEYVETISPLSLSKERRKQPNDAATKDELTSFLRLTGKRNFLGHGCLPVASFVASHSIPQHTLPRCSIVLTDKVHRLLRCVAREAILWPDRIYIWHLFQTPTELVFHVIDWHSSKQSRTSFSLIGAEILAAASAADRSSLMIEGIRSIHDADDSLPLVLNVDSLGLHPTISTVHEGKDYRL